MIDLGDATIDRAIAAGLAADRLGMAFVGGYRAALEKLTGSSKRASLAATEKGGARPRNIATTFAEGKLNGEKTFATLASSADEILVVAKVGEHEGKNRLALVRVVAGAAGMTVVDRAPLPFAPEIPHARVTLVDVAGEVLPGDGYSDYLKPFRTIEDTHVLGATMGYLLGEAGRSGFASSFSEDATLLTRTLMGIAEKDPNAPETHLLLASTFEEAQRLLAKAEWDKSPAEVRERWQRDAPLLLVAETVRAARTAAAREKLRGA